MKTITEKDWEHFFNVVGKLSVVGENEGMSEKEVMVAIWEKAESEGYTSELEELVYGLEEVRQADDTEPQTGDE